MEDHLWTVTPKGTHLRIDGLKLWLYEGEWRFKTNDCGYGRINEEHTFRPHLNLTYDQARDWVDKEIPFRVATIRMLMCS